MMQTIAGPFSKQSAEDTARALGSKIILFMVLNGKTQTDTERTFTTIMSSVTIQSYRIKFLVMMLINYLPSNTNKGTESMPKPLEFLKAYRHARIGLPPADDSLISIAAQIAAENRRASDTIGDSYRFALDLAGGPRERRRPSKRTKVYSGEFDNLRNDGVYRNRQTAARLPDLWAD